MKYQAYSSHFNVESILLDKHKEKARRARNFLRTAVNGVLSTFSFRYRGHPFGSVLPYVLDHKGRVIMLMANRAEHTLNIQEDPRCCLTVYDHQTPEEVGSFRVTVMGEAEKIPGGQLEEAMERYFRMLPNHKLLYDSHHLNFYWIIPEAVKLMEGMGQFYWLDQRAWEMTSPDWIYEEGALIVEFNKSEFDILTQIASKHLGTSVDYAAIVGLSKEGVHMRAMDKVFYISFSEPCFTKESVKQELLRLSQF